MNRNDLVWLDLCSGLGGASQPAKDREWRVIRVDIDPRFKPDVVADVRSMPLRPFHIDVLWASTPCTEYSKWQLRCFYPNPPVPDISLEVGVLRAIHNLKPHWWIAENVWAARRWLTPLFGPTAAMIPGHALWGRLPCLLPYTAPHKGGMGYWKPGRWGPVGHGRYPKVGTAIRTGHNGCNASEAAKIPYEIGEAICMAVERKRGAA